MTSIREPLPARLLEAFASGAEATRLQRYAGTLTATPPQPLLPVPPTPTRNTSLPFRRGGFASLVEALDYAAQGETGLNFFSTLR